MISPRIRRAFLTGASGFIGSRLIEHLKQAGWEIAAISRPHSARVLKENCSVSSVYDYTGKTEEVVAAMIDSRPDTVFHLASLFITAHDSTQIEPLIASNVTFGTQLLEAMRAARVSSLVNCGTAWQTKFDGARIPVNLYAATKQAFEEILSYYTDETGIRATTLRLCDSYGPGDRRPKIFRLLLDCLQSGTPLRLSPGDQILDLTHVDDICRAFLEGAKAVEQQELGNSVYAVSGGQRRTLRQVVATLEEAAGHSLPVQFGALPYRSREVMIPWTGHPLPGWKPQIDLLTGFKMLLNSDLDKRG